MITRVVGLKLLGLENQIGQTEDRVKERLRKNQRSIALLGYTICTSNLFDKAC